MAKSGTRFIRHEDVSSFFTKQDCGLLWPILPLVKLNLDHVDRGVMDRAWHLSLDSVSIVVKDNM
jgi:hypothetical protein